MKTISSQKGVDRMKLVRLAVFACVALLITGCSQEDKEQISRLALPDPASDRAEAIFHLWVGAWIASLVVFVLVFGLMLWAMIRYRRRSDDEVPSQLRYHLPLEVLYTIAPIIVVAVFFYHTVAVQNETLATAADHAASNGGGEVAEPQTIEVVASKWQFTFNHFTGDDIHDEEQRENPDNWVYAQGSPEELPTLILPVDEPVRFELYSPDVIHSFWIPEFYFKQDIIPGRSTEQVGEDAAFEMTPTREGEFIGRCAELCGVYHTRMLFQVQVVSADEYAAHLDELEASGRTGRPRGPRYADTVAGLESNGDDD